MTKPTMRSLAAAAPLAFLVACGGSSSPSGSTAASPAELASAIPAMSSVQLADDAVDAAPAAMAPTPGPTDPATVILGDPCNPHLFLRSQEIVVRVNRHVFKFLSRAAAAVAANPTLASGQSATWNKTIGGIDVQVTVTKNADGTFSWTLGLKKTADATFVVVATGSLDRTGATAANQGKGQLSLDLGKLATVTGEEVAGTIDAAFESFADHRLVSVHAAGVVWDTDARSVFARTPRDADYVSLREKGKGGSLKVSEQVAFACPVNPTAEKASMGLVNRWTLTSTGSVHGRSDAQLTGGQLPAAIAKVVALTCHQSATAADAPSEGAWLLKAEDASGATVWGRESVRGTTPCDPALNPPSGDVPTLADDKTDFDFSAVTFTDGKPYPFPGM